MKTAVVFLQPRTKLRIVALALITAGTICSQNSGSNRRPGYVRREWRQWGEYSTRGSTIRGVDIFLNHRSSLGAFGGAEKQANLHSSILLLTEINPTLKQKRGD